MNQRCRDTPICLSLCLLLAGCGVEIQGWEVDSVQRQCESHGGIHRLDNFIGVRGICRDGAVFNAKRGGQ